MARYKIIGRISREREEEEINLGARRQEKDQKMFTEMEKGFKKKKPHGRTQINRSRLI